MIYLRSIMDFFNQQTQNIPGLQYVENYFSSQEQDALMRTIDKQEWLGDLKRRVQHYGFKYDYKARKIDLDMRIGELPDWAKSIAERLHSEGYCDMVPDQLIINEYLPGQGITPHIDCEPCFEDTIVSISLGSYCVMDFAHKETFEKRPILLAPRSMVVLKGESRYGWTHGIASRKTDKHEGAAYPRTRRISLTFRKTILG